MKNYNKLKQIIQEANPEIMELKFGCEIMISEDKKDTEYIMLSGAFCCLKYYVSKIIDIRGMIKNITILGRPIRLADVLLTLGEKYGMDGTGMLLERQYGTSAYDCAGMRTWNLKDDNLDNQTKETKEFLIKLLVK